MVQDSELPKNNNLNTETNTHFDTISVNDQKINDTDIQNNNETLIDEYETLQDNSNLSPNNDSTNTSPSKESADDTLNNIE